GPPLAFGLRAVGGMRLAFAMVTVMAVLLVLVVARLPSGAARPAASARAPRLISRSALPVSFALVLSTIGHSSVFAFLPLYALGRGETAALAWFFAIYPAWLITWRALLRGVSDRLGHFRVGLFAMSVVAVAYLIIALPPTALSLALAALVLASGNALLYPTLAALVVHRLREQGEIAGGVEVHARHAERPVHGAIDVGLRFERLVPGRVRALRRRPRPARDRLDDLHGRVALAADRQHRLERLAIAGVLRHEEIVRQQDRVEVVAREAAAMHGRDRPAVAGDADEAREPLGL